MLKIVVILNTHLMDFRHDSGRPDMRLDRAGSIGLHVGPLGFGSKIDEKMNEKRDIFQEVLFDGFSLKKLGQWAPNGGPKWPKGGQWGSNGLPRAPQKPSF